MLRSVAARLLAGLLITAVSAKGGARLADAIAVHLFGATGTVLVQWAVAITIAALGLFTTLHGIKEASVSERKD